MKLLNKSEKIAVAGGSDGDTGRVRDVCYCMKGNKQVLYIEGKTCEGSESPLNFDKCEKICCDVFQLGETDGWIFGKRSRGNTTALRSADCVTISDTCKE